jgi:hypothetical protein
MPWPLVAAAGIAAVGGIISSLAQKDAPEYEPEVLPKTVSGNVVSDMDFLFDIEAHEAMQYLTTQMNDWSQEDRGFFKDQFEPFQASLIEANQDLIPDIVANSGTALKQNMKDMMGSDFLKETFRSQITDAGGDIGRFATDFAQQIDNIPSAEERVGQVVSGIEQRFGQAGKELKRQMASKGLDVSEASQRDLAINKAMAKAAGTDQAQEAARSEKLAGTERGIGVLGAVQQSQSAMLTAERGLTQAGAGLLPQLGVQENLGVGAAGQQTAALTTSMSEKILGQDSEVKQAEFTQPGIVTPRFFDKETGKMVDAAGNEIKAPVAPVVSRFGGSSSNKRVLGGRGGPGVGPAEGTGASESGHGTGGIGPGGGGGAGIGGGNGAGGGAGSGVCCFVAGTKVSTPTGPVNIEDITPLDVILSLNMQTNLIQFSKVGSVKVVERSKYYNIEFDSGRVLKITDDHPLHTDNGWESIDPAATYQIEAYDHIDLLGRLNADSLVWTEDGGMDRVKSIEPVLGDITTYTLCNVTPAMNFFADGYLASNKI